MKKYLWVFIWIGFCNGPGLFAEPDPEAFLKDALGNPHLRSGDYGEQYCWNVNYSAAVFLDAYEAYENPEWLEAASKYYDAAVKNLSTDPDGYPGWIGTPIGSKGNSAYLTDSVVGDAIVSEHLVRFAEIVKANPGLNERFGAKAREYASLAARICWDKFESRGQTYQCEDGYISYPTYSKMVDKQTGEWVEFPSRVISNNLNKHYSLGLVLLRLWRITGEEKYKERVLRIYGRSKAMWRYYPDEDRIVWNFWMPHGPYDIEGSSPKSWVSVHPSRSGYQKSEVAMFVEVFDSGLVYTREDLRKMVNTNLWMSRNGWKNAEGGTAGELWPALVRFSPEIRDLYKTKIEKGGGVRGEIARDHFRNVTSLKLNPERRYVRSASDVQWVNPPLQPGIQLSMALPIPNRLELNNSQSIQLACKTRKPGELVIELLGPDRVTVLRKLESIPVQNPNGEYAAPIWDGNGVTGAGQYFIRWSINGESRMERVVVVEGAAEKAGADPWEMKPGQTVKIDFEQDLDTRIWTVEDAAPSKELARTGTHSLQVKRNAVLKFGREKHRDLPVKISMWVYDSGVEHRGNGNGPAWGIIDTLGNKFCLRMVWRKYLNGDRHYSWLNTGENQWFTPHPAGISRKKGWNRWIFDFSGDSPSVTMDGEPLRDPENKYVPQGAVSLYFLNGNPGGPLYIDDVEISLGR